MTISSHGSGNLVYRTVNDLFRELALKEIPFQACPITVEQMGALVDMVQKNTITGKIGKDVLHIMLQEGGGNPQEIVDKKGWARIDDSALLKSICENLVSKNTAQVCIDTCRHASHDLNILL